MTITLTREQLYQTRLGNSDRRSSEGLSSFPTSALGRSAVIARFPCLHAATSRRNTPATRWSRRPVTAVNQRNPHLACWTWFCRWSPGGACWTSAMEAGIADYVWSIDELTGFL